MQSIRKYLNDKNIKYITKINNNADLVYQFETLEYSFEITDQEKFYHIEIVREGKEDEKYDFDSQAEAIQYLESYLK